MNYGISEEGISVTYGDEITQVPDNTSSEPGADGLINYYELLEVNDPKAVLWRKKLGQSLANFLKSNDNIDDIPSERAILKNFPPGYLLYEHRKQNPKGGMRTDTYLYGNHRFRSPNEFMPHLFWLASDKSKSCNCKYCRSSSHRSGKSSSTKAEQRSKSDVANKERTAKKQVKGEIKRGKKKGKYERVKKVDQPMDEDVEEDVAQMVDDSEPKVRKEPGESNAMIFRDGEIVWLDVKRIIDDDLLSKCDEINGAPIKYWPATIVKVNSDVSGQVSESDTFTLETLMLHGQKEVNIDSIKPWITYTPENTKSTNIRKAKSGSGIDLEDPNPQHVVRAYNIAIQKAHEIAATYTTIMPYKYRHSKESPTELKKLESYPHFRAIFFGPEILEEDDMVRLVPVNNESSSGGDPTKRGSFLQITSIYMDSKKTIKITGDAYDRGESVGVNKYKWHPVNTDNEEFTVELSDVSGRFYPLWPHMTETITCEYSKKLQQRRAMYAKDSSEITSDLWLKMKPQLETESVATKNRQVATRQRQYAKRALPFKTPTEAANKKRVIEVEHSKITMSIDTSISGSSQEPVKASATPQGEYPIKILDIDRVMHSGINDNDIPPSVLSPDTPTFESEEETKDAEIPPPVTSNKEYDNDISK